MVGLAVVHPKENTCVAYIKENKDVKFTEQGKFMESVLTKSGIHIPRDRLIDFNNIKVIHFKRDDENFAKAFLEIYFPHALKESGFIIKKADET